MRKLDRYIGRNVLGAILLVLLILVLLDSLFSFIDQLSDLRAQYGVMNALWYTLLGLPQNIYNYLPFAALIGCLVGLGTMASNSELVVMRAAGVSLARMIAAVFKPALLLMLIGITLGEFAVPYTSQLAESYRTVLRLQDGAFSTEGVWHRDGNEYIYIEAVEPNGVLHGVSRFKFDGHDLKLASRADRAILQGDHWLLEDVKSSNLTGDKVISKNAHLERWDSDLSPETLKIITVSPDNLSMRGLLSYANYLRSQGLNSDNYDLHFWTKALQPLAMLALVLVGISFVFGPLRSVTMGLRVFTGVIVGFTFMIFQQLIGPASLVFGFSPLLAVLTPIMLCLLVGALLLRRAG